MFLSGNCAYRYPEFSFLINGDPIEISYSEVEGNVPSHIPETDTPSGTTVIVKPSGETPVTLLNFSSVPLST